MSRISAAHVPILAITAPSGRLLAIPTNTLADRLRRLEDAGIVGPDRHFEIGSGPWGLQRRPTRR